MNNTKEKRSGISMLRITATIAVIFLHTCSTLTQNPDLFLLQEDQTAFYTIAYYLMHWSVPVFFMITGALLLKPEKPIPVSEILRKYILRMVLALFLFGVPFSWMDRITGGSGFSGSVIGRGFLDVITGSSWRHLWYIYILLEIYFLLPVLKAVVGTLKKKELEFTLAGLLIGCFGLNMVGRLCGISIAFAMETIGYPLFYVLMGWYLASYSPEWTKNRKLLIVVLAGCTALMVLLLKGDLFYRGLFEYESPVVAAMAIALFSLFLNIKEPDTAGLWKLDRLCLCAYLVHPFFIHMSYKYFGYLPVNRSSWQAATFVFLICFTALSFLASWVLSLIGPLDKWVLRSRYKASFKVLPVIAFLAALCVSVFFVIGSRIPDSEKEGFVLEYGKTRYYDPETHEYLVGQKKIDDDWYMFDPESGKMIRGFYHHTEETNPSGGEKICFYDNAGHMVYGQRFIDGYWYNFNTGSGAMMTGFIEIPSQDKICYYDEQGHMLYGTQVIGGVTYEFDKASGALISGEVPEDE